MKSKAILAILLARSRTRATSLGFGHDPMPHSPARSYLSRRDAVKVIHTTRDLFFVYKDNPREFRALINIRRSHRVDMEVLSRLKSLDAWPERLPAILPLPTQSQWWLLEIQSYGRGFGPSLENEVRESLGWFIHELTTEGSQTGEISKQSYYHAFVKLQFKSNRPGDPKAGMTRGVMVELLKEIRAICFTPHNWGPREFVGTFFTDTPLVEETLSFMDPP